MKLVGNTPSSPDDSPPSSHPGANSVIFHDSVKMKKMRDEQRVRQEAKEGG